MMSYMFPLHCNKMVNVIDFAVCSFSVVAGQFVSLRLNLLAFSFLVKCKLLHSIPPETGFKVSFLDVVSGAPPQSAGVHNSRTYDNRLMRVFR